MKWIFLFALVSLANQHVLGSGGLLEFRNFYAPMGTNRINAPVYDSQGIPLEGRNYLVELYGGSTPQDLKPALDSLNPGRRRIVPFDVQGYFRQGFVEIPSAAITILAWVQVRAWDARLGATYEEAASRGLGGYGESPLFQVLTGGFGGPPTLPGQLYGLRSFRLRSATGVLMEGVLRQGNVVVIQRLGGFKRYQLQQSAGLNEPWQNLGEPTTATTATNTLASGMQFFRVIGFVEFVVSRGWATVLTRGNLDVKHILLVR